MLYEIGNAKGISVSNNRRNEIDIETNDSIISKLFSDFCKMYKLLELGTIDDNIFELWLEVKFKELNIPIGENGKEE